jgi:hypothetical protein
MANYSGSITSGGTAQTAAAADPFRQSLFLENPSDTDLWYAFGTTAVADSPSFLLAAGSDAVFGPEHRGLITQSVSVLGATTGKKFTIVDSKL